MAAPLSPKGLPRGRSLAAEFKSDVTNSGSDSPSCAAMPPESSTCLTLRNHGDRHQDHHPPVSTSSSSSPSLSTGRPECTRARSVRSQSLPNLFADGHGGGVWPSHWASLPPQQYVDYLHHPWTDDDLTTSWKLITKLKHSDRALKLGGKGERLEYLTWRIWIQRTRRLSKTHPYTIHWEKDSSHLYAPGPIFRAKSCFHMLPADLPTPSSPVPSSTLSTPPLSPSSQDHFKGCLKRQTLRDVLLRPLHSSPSPHFVLSDPPAGSAALRRRTVEEHERLMRNALATASSDDSYPPRQPADLSDQLASPDPSPDCPVLVCTATASHPALNLNAADTQVVRFNHVIEERVISGPSRTVVVASRKRRSRSLVMAVLDGDQAKAYKRVVDKWVGLDASKPLTMMANRGRPRARSDPPSSTVAVSYLPRSTSHRTSRSIQDSAIAFSALVDDLLSSPENEDVISFVSSPPSPRSPSTSRSSTPTHPPASPSSSAHSPPLIPADDTCAVALASPACRDLQLIHCGGNEPNDDMADDDTPTWERSTLARGRDHALPPFHVDESTLAMLALPYAVGAPPPSLSGIGVSPDKGANHVVDLPTPPPSSPVTIVAKQSEHSTLEAVADLLVPVPLSQRPPSPAILGSPPRRKPKEPQVLAKVVARGTGWGIGHLDECELGSHSSSELEPVASEEDEQEDDDVRNQGDGRFQRQPDGSFKEAVTNVADAVGWLVDMVAGRTGLFST
ncbi:hypothetical protein BCR44DRAFT_34781 [Catenaria anguillulae PL171]|uniref:Nitrogen regulatory protein areA GATA-like domain-containing protein n=1 Tax=Catenaria anguillulae PL171 TaxID=765915 RepID=A0A1Y2I1Y1_9FUNG|nr:hypothetical protein BCR44DRAFT_34781 [Catenaria anguillulae PL171]